jgi:hypothetical protein
MMVSRGNPKKLKEISAPVALRPLGISHEVFRIEKPTVCPPELMEQPLTTSYSTVIVPSPSRSVATSVTGDSQIPTVRVYYYQLSI